MHISARSSRHAALALLGIAAGALGACTPSRGDAVADSAAPATATALIRGDSTVGTMSHDSTGAMGTTAMHEAAATDSNQAFLRMMVDHHEGLLMMVTAAQPKLEGATPKADAQQLAATQRGEQTRMTSMLVSTYHDEHHPMILPSNRAMNDSLQITEVGPTYDKDFYHHVVAHHREGVQMIDRMLSHLTGDVKTMAQKSKADQMREIQSFERKAGGPGPKG